MDNLNQRNESDTIREKSNALKEMIMQNADSSATGGGHLPPGRKKRGERKTNAIFEKAVTRSRMTADEYRASLMAEAEAKAKEARIAAEAKAKEEAMALEELRRKAEAEAKAKAEEIERLKAQAAAEAEARKEELARVRAEAEESARRQAEEAARLAKEEAEEAARLAKEEAEETARLAREEAEEATRKAEEAARKVQEEAAKLEEKPIVADVSEENNESFETADRFFDNKTDASSTTSSSDDLFETENVMDSAVTPDRDEEPPVFEEEAPVFNEEPPVFEEEAPVFNEEPSVFEEDTPVFNEEPPVFEEDTLDFEESAMVENQDDAPGDLATQSAFESETAETDTEAKSDDFGFAIDTMTKSEAASELKYDHSAYRTRRKPHNTSRTTEIPWVIPGNVQENTPPEETTESTPEPQKAVEAVQPEESPAIQTPIPAESRNEREERDVLSLLDTLDKTGETEFKEEANDVSESEKTEADDALSKGADDKNLTEKVDKLFETDNMADDDEALFSTEDLSADAASANTLFDTEEIIEESSAKEADKKADTSADDLFETEVIETKPDNDAVSSEPVKEDDLFEESLADMPEIPESNDDLFETESIETTDTQTSFKTETLSTDSIFEKEESFDDNTDALSKEATVKTISPVEAAEDLFEEEPVTEESDRFDTKPIANKVDALFEEEPVDEKQDDLSSKASKADKSTVPMLDELYDLDDHIADQAPVEAKTEAPKAIKQEPIKPIEKPAETNNDAFDIEMIDLDSINVNRVVDNGAGDTRTPSEILSDDSNDVNAVNLSAPKAQPKTQVNIESIDSLDDLFSVETVPEKVETKVKTVTEKIVPDKAADTDSLFESEIITPASQTAPLPNLDPKATTPLEKQDMSAQSKVSKAFDVLFEEDEA